MARLESSMIVPIWWKSYARPNNIIIAYCIDLTYLRIQTLFAAYVALSSLLPKEMPER